MSTAMTAAMGGRNARMKSRSRVRTRAISASSQAGSGTQVPPPVHRTRRGHGSAERSGPERSGELGLQGVPFLGELVDDGVGVAASAGRLDDRGRDRLGERAPPQGLARQLVDILGLIDDDVVALDLA